MGSAALLRLRCYGIVTVGIADEGIFFWCEIGHKRAEELREVSCRRKMIAAGGSQRRIADTRK